MHNRQKGYMRYFTSTQRTKINPLKPEISSLIRIVGGGVQAGSTRHVGH
jgi:hypothetical protein